jgi:hypothetical protein
MVKEVKSVDCVEDKNSMSVRCRRHSKNVRWSMLASMPVVLMPLSTLARSRRDFLTLATARHLRAIRLTNQFGALFFPPSKELSALRVRASLGFIIRSAVSSNFSGCDFQKAAIYTGCR